MQERNEFCHNCGIRLAGPFCSACGQKSVPLSVTLHEFAHELTHEMLHVDGRLFQSVRRLLLSPGFLTREYVQGRRARWISPIRLYLIFSVIYFGLGAATKVEDLEVRWPSGAVEHFDVPAVDRTPPGTAESRAGRW